MGRLIDFTNTKVFLKSDHIIMCLYDMDESRNANGPSYLLIVVFWLVWLCMVVAATAKHKTGLSLRLTKCQKYAYRKQMQQKVARFAFSVALLYSTMPCHTCLEGFSSQTLLQYSESGLQKYETLFIPASGNILYPCLGLGTIG